MRLSVRNGVFETNSSSVHSISVVKMRTKGDWESYLEEEYKKGAAGGSKIVFRPKCYGWEFALLDDVNEKASYLASVAYHLISSEVPDGENEYEAYLDRFAKQAKKWLDEDNLAYRFAKPKVSKWSSGCEYVEASVGEGVLRLRHVLQGEFPRVPAHAEFHRVDRERQQLRHPLPRGEQDQVVRRR